MIFKLELDLHMYFVPPMEEHSGAIVLTRTVYLPFVPAAEITIHSSAFEDMGSAPVGFALKGVIWDIDRHVFLAHTELISHDVPWPYIVGEIQNWLAHGWRLGSYTDPYGAKWREQENLTVATKSKRPSKNWPDEDVMEKWPALPPKERPKHFNRTFRIITRMLADTRNADRLAYAMHQTQMYFTEEQLKGDRTPAMQRFQKALDEFYKEPYKKQERRINRILAAYPSLAEAIAE